MAIRPGGMTDEEFKRLNPTAPGAQAGAAVGQSLRTAGRFGASLASELARPPVQGFNTFFGGIDKGVQAANNFVASAVTGRPVSSPIAQPPMLAGPRPVPATPGASASMAKMSAGQSPSQSMTLDQASQREVAARNQASRPGTSLGAGASTTAGRAALRPDGVAVVKMPDGTNAYGANGRSVGYAQGTMGTVNTQNFGNPVVPQGPGAIASPRVASTFGMGVNDPRLDSQIARPPVQLGPNQTAGGGTLASPSSMGRYYANKEDREATAKAAGDIDTLLFQLRGKTDPASLRTLAELTQTKAQMLGGQAGNTTSQANVNAQGEFGLANTGMVQGGENNRAGIQADTARAGQQVTREGQQLNFQSSMADIARPQLKQDANGNFVNIAGNAGTAVLGADGKPIQGQVDRQQAAQISPDAILRSFDAEEKSLTDRLFNAPPEQQAVLQQQLSSIQEQRNAIRGGGQAASTAPTLDAYVKAARAAGFKESDAELAASFQKKYPQAK